MKKPTKPKKRNPNDATFRNINALKKRVNTIWTLYEVMLEFLQGRYGVFSRINELEARVKELESYFGGKATVSTYTWKGKKLEAKKK